MTAEDSVRITARGPATGTPSHSHRGASRGLGVPIEMIVFLATAVAVLIACQIADSFDARLAWILVTALAVAYILSRGLAKRGNVPDDR